jgi:cell division septation protein DedD
MPEQQNDTEITLGVGKLLGLFFMLVILCGVFLSLGYMLGRNSGKQEGMLASDPAAPGTISNAAKPGATQATPQKPVTDAQQQPAPEKTDLSFYKSVEQKDANPQLQKPESSPAQAPAQAPEMKALANGGYVVQVAAVSKKEDADALQQALQHKQYPVVVTTGGTDKLFHVQIGPYAELKDAESMKTRLASDGYNAIVKR